MTFLSNDIFSVHGYGLAWRSADCSIREILKFT